MTGADLVDVEVCVHDETPKALLISADGNRFGAQWVPKSRVTRRRVVLRMDRPLAALMKLQVRP